MQYFQNTELDSNVKWEYPYTKHLRGPMSHFVSWEIKVLVGVEG